MGTSKLPENACELEVKLKLPATWVASIAVMVTDPIAGKPSPSPVTWQKPAGPCGDGCSVPA